MTNNNWIETMKTIGKISSIHPEIVDEFILITKDLLTQKDQEHKAELESIKGEILELQRYILPEIYDTYIHTISLKDVEDMLNSHINKL